MFRTTLKLIFRNRWLARMAHGKSQSRGEFEVGVKRKLEYRFQNTDLCIQFCAISVNSV